MPAGGLSSGEPQVTGGNQKAAKRIEDARPRLDDRTDRDSDEGAEGRVPDGAIERGATKKRPADGRRERSSEIATATAPTCKKMYG